MSQANAKAKRSGCTVWLVRLAVAAGLVILFLKDLRQAWEPVKGLVFSLLGRPVLPASWKPVLFLAAAGLLFFLFYLLILLVISQVILPVHTLADRRRIFTRLLLSAPGRAGAAMFVSEGAVIASRDELQKSLPGMIFVDASSAIILEKQNPGGPASGMVRVLGPGIAFTRGDEKLRGIVDLRKQHRTIQGVSAYTSDGVEVAADISVTFSLGQPPQVLKVALMGKRAEDLRVLVVDEASKTIQAVRDELDSLDKAEIFAFINSGQGQNTATAGLELRSDQRETPPYLIQKSRLFAAIYSQGHLVKGGGQDHWTDLPALVAVEVFRSMISQEVFEGLYQPENPARFPLKEEFRPAFELALRNRGVLAFQVIQRRDRRPPAVGEVIHKTQFSVSPVMDLRQAKVLRDRGIKVIQASFGELKPANPAVGRQRLERWRARWQKEVQPAAPQGGEQEIIQIHNQGRDQAQHELKSQMARLLQNGEAGAAQSSQQLFLLLETVRQDPEVVRLLPEMTLRRFDELRYFLDADRAEAYPAEPSTFSGDAPGQDDLW